MSNTATIAYRELHRHKSVIIDHGRGGISLTIVDSAGGFTWHTITPAEARQLAKELNRRADEIEGKKQ